MTTARDIDTLFLEERRYPPSAEFSAQANAQPGIYEEDFDAFWEREGRERVAWFEPFTKLYEWEPPYARWYLGGTLNVAWNCLDKHVEAGRGDSVAYYWEGEPADDRRALTYAQLLAEVTKLANALKELGVGKGTPVGIYLGMVPEAPVAMLACARLGAPHTVVFGGFSADSLSGRLQDMGCEVLITQDEAWRRGTTVPLKRTADEAVDASPTVKNVIVLRRTGNDVPMTAGRDHWWHELAVDESACPAEPMGPEDLLYLLYTSGTTAKPKGIVHTTAGYLVGVAATHHYIFDLKRDTDVYWCAADVGWVTGHSYIVYGPLCNGATSVMYEGTPDFPDKDRWWDVVERYGVTILYTAPTAIRSHMKWGPEHAAKHDLSKLRLLGLGRRADQPRGVGLVPRAHRRRALPDRRHVVADRDGDDHDHAPAGDHHHEAGLGEQAVPRRRRGDLQRGGRRGRSRRRRLPGAARPWPAMLRGLYQENDRYVDTYWSRYTDVYFAGDGARIDEDGDFWLLGRVDDVMNVSGHRISTIEVESALVDHRDVAEAAVAARNDATTGQAIVAFVTLKSGVEPSVAKLDELRDHVAKKIGPIAKPANIVFTPELPKTRSGKIMRRLLRDVAENRPLGDTTTLADPSVVAELQSRGADEQSKED